MRTHWCLRHVVQKLPGRFGGGRRWAAIEDGLRRIQLIADTLTPEELRTLRNAEILHRLFNEDDLRFVRTIARYISLPLLRERSPECCRTWRSRDTLSDCGNAVEVLVHCDFCNRAYLFDAVDLAQLFKATVAATAAALFTALDTAYDHAA